MCFTPITIKSKRHNTSHAVPCGRCPKCRARRASAWSFRLMEQEKKSIMCHFLTLTYDTLHVPLTKSGFLSLSRTDLPSFFKRLRKALFNYYVEKNAKDAWRPLKYYAVGEYGSRTDRPHYHVILFDCPHELVQNAWQKGSVHYGTVTGASVGYTLKYLSKERRVPKHCNDDRVPEFSLMSKGLGLSYLTQGIKKWHTADLTGRMFCNTIDGKKIAMPRYYKDKIYSDAQRNAIAAYFRIQADKAALNCKLTDTDKRNLVKSHAAALARFSNYKTVNHGKKIDDSTRIEFKRVQSFFNRYAYRFYSAVCRREWQGKRLCDSRWYKIFVHIAEIRAGESRN